MRRYDSQGGADELAYLHEVRRSEQRALIANARAKRLKAEAATGPHSCTAPDLRAAVVARVDARLAEHRPMKPLTTVWVNDGRADTLAWCEACDVQWPCAVAVCVRHGVVECPLCRSVGSKESDDGR